MLLWITLAFAMEPGASRGALEPDCACMEIQPGAHADKHSMTWRALPQASHLEHLEVANKPMLSAAMKDRSRVSLAERDAIVGVASDIFAVTPLELRDQGTGHLCKHLQIPSGEPRDLEIVLAHTTEARIDAAAVGRALRTRATAAQQCLGAGASTTVQLKVSAGGKISVSEVQDSPSEEAGACVKKALKGLKADLSQKAGGEQHYQLQTP